MSNKKYIKSLGHNEVVKCLGFPFGILDHFPARSYWHPETRGYKTKIFPPVVCFTDALWAVRLFEKRLRKVGYKLDGFYTLDFSVLSMNDCEFDYKYHNSIGFTYRHDIDKILIRLIVDGEPICVRYLGQNREFLNIFQNFGVFNQPPDEIIKFVQDCRDNVK
ncbi:hypothetical protein ASwh1_281 [Aeromonas phage Aswh_1]|nr:hypothetical protein ASwh1_281 [Aeromonas phage Aswh_1]